MPNGGQNLTGSTSKHSVSLTTGGKASPTLAKAPKQQKLSFSFAYFSQYPYFGVAGENTHWFASLIDRLKDLSNKSPDIMGNYTARDQYRIHRVDWNQRNIPIQRKDLISIPEVYRDNEEEYPFLQFQISKSRGRVAGFFDEESAVFYVVLFDPKHNLQPTKDHDYKVDNTTPLPTPYEIALKLTKKCTHIGTCPIETDKITTDDSFRAIFYDTDDAGIIDVLKQNGISFHDAFCQFILNQL